MSRVLERTVWEAATALVFVITSLLAFVFVALLPGLFLREVWASLCFQVWFWPLYWSATDPRALLLFLVLSVAEPRLTSGPDPLLVAYPRLSLLLVGLAVLGLAAAVGLLRNNRWGFHLSPVFNFSVMCLSFIIFRTLETLTVPQEAVRLAALLIFTLHLSVWLALWAKIIPGRRKQTDRPTHSPPHP